MIDPPQPSLDEPGTWAFTAERAFRGRHLNRFCLSLRDPADRAAFLADEDSYGLAHGLDPHERDLVRERDWTGLLRAGAHLQGLLKLAATVGGNLWDIGAHNVGTTPEELVACCPRTVSFLPDGG